MRLRQENLKESPGQYARGEFYRKHFSVPHKFTVHLSARWPTHKKKNVAERLVVKWNDDDDLPSNAEIYQAKILGRTGL